jgi:hypothetical protein
MANPNDSNCVLLLHCDGADAHTTFTDNAVGTSGETVTAVANAQGDTAQFKWGTASLLLNGSTDWLTIPEHASWAFGTGKFTIDMWIRFNSTSGTQGFMARRNDAQDNWYWGVTGDQIYFSIFSGGTQIITMTSATQTLNTDTWYHIAVVRGWGGNANDWALTLDGTAIATLTDSDGFPTLTGVLNIGRYESPAGTSYEFNGWMDEIRISKGVARWTANFAAPSRAYPNSNVWTGKVSAVENPSKVATIAESGFSKVSGVGSMGGG